MVLIYVFADKKQTNFFKQKFKKFIYLIFSISIGIFYFNNLSVTKLNSIEYNSNCVIYVDGNAGRLGNRMFVVATGYGLARLHHCYLYITPDIIKELQEIFITDFSPILISQEVFQNINKSMNMTSHSVLCESSMNLTYSNGILNGIIFHPSGYWQSYLSFSKYENEICKRIFIGKPSILLKISKFFMDIYQEKFNRKLNLSIDNHQLLKQQLTSIQWIGVHIRLGDFVAANLSSNTQYLFDSMNYFQKQFSNVSFIIASDDKTYCKNLFHNQSNVFLTPSTFSPGDDMITLSLCQHSIITGGTFGWWSAYLAGGQVLHDKVYPSPCHNVEEYYPSRFKTIS